MAAAAILRRRALPSSCLHGQCPLSLMACLFPVRACFLAFHELQCVSRAHLHGVCSAECQKPGARYAALVVSPISIHFKFNFTLHV
jgi:hypothetical protein